MARVQDEDEIYDEINVVPMLDLSLVLIIIFILMATAQVAGMELELPQASNREQLDMSEAISISVLASGEIYLDGAPISLAELQNRLQEVRAADGSTPVIVRGDGGAAYSAVISVLDTAKSAGLTQIGLPTTALKPGER